jgi:hypothetical protein
VVIQEGLRQNPEKVRAIVEYPVPNSETEVLRFLGMCEWYSGFIPHFADLAEPLHELQRGHKFRKKGEKAVKVMSKFVWGERQQLSFESLKRAMCEDVLLHGLDYEFPIIVKTYASDVGLGAVLTQLIDGKERVVFYASKTLTHTERNLGACDKECLAIVWELNKFRGFLWGEKFTLMTDSKALTYLKSSYEIS